MNAYRICLDISFVEDHEKLVVLNFESGDYYIVDGVCKTIIELINEHPYTEEELYTTLKERYNPDEYDLIISIRDALDSLKENGFVETIMIEEE